MCFTKYEWPLMAGRRYLDLLRAEDGINEKVWGELRALSEMKFQFRDKQPPYSYASSLAHCMQVGGSTLCPHRYLVCLPCGPSQAAHTCAPGAGLLVV